MESGEGIIKNGDTVRGEIRSVVSGGLLVSIEVEAFLPASQIDITNTRNLHDYIGRVFDFKVIRITNESGTVVLSRRELIEKERSITRQRLLAELEPGQIRRGTVKTISEFGAFIDLNGVDGLLHISDMNCGPVEHPSAVLRIGQNLDVVVLDIDREKERVGLGIKPSIPPR